MTGFEIYVFILCLIVFSLLTATFAYLIACITKMEIKLIGYGHRDESIKKEREKELNKNKRLSQAMLWSNRIFSLLICLALIAVFVFAIYVRTTEDKPANGIPSIKIVKSESMAKKHYKNTYLFENHLDNQFQMFDVVICRHLPAEEDLELYDIVVYKQDDVYVIHRIVGIEEPNEKHPDERHFLLQGDAVQSPDTFPVLYSQMQSIYEGDRIPFVGSFLLFLQSPAGWLCILLIVFVMIVTPIVEKLIEKARRKRLALLFPPLPEQESITDEESVDALSAEEPTLEPQVATVPLEEAPRYKLPAAMLQRASLTAEYVLVFRHTDYGRSCEIGTNVLNRYYHDGETVDVYSLKEKKILKKYFKQIKIISVGKLNKRLLVRVDSCSRRALEAIVKAGGSFEATPNQANPQDFEVTDND